MCGKNLKPSVLATIASVSNDLSLLRRPLIELKGARAMRTNWGRTPSPTRLVYAAALRLILGMLACRSPHNAEGFQAVVPCARSETSSWFPEELAVGVRHSRWPCAGGAARIGNSGGCFRNRAMPGGFRRRPRGITGARMIDTAAVSALWETGAVLHLAVGGSLAASSPLVLVDKNTLNLALGAFSGMVATAAVFPIDTAKTKIQSQSGQDGEAALNTLETIQQIARDQGVGALYRGLIPVLVGSAPESAIQLTVFTFAAEALRGAHPGAEKSLLLVSVAGMIAGTAQVVVTNPLEVLMNTNPCKPPRTHAIDRVSQTRSRCPCITESMNGIHLVRH